ncbi:hypothetical protein BH10CYA1_BH10CYA1_13290 [soil metagenome]
MTHKTEQTTQATCPITGILELIAAKWTVEIMREVSIKPTRTRQFLTHVPALSMKSLTVRLKELESFGMIKRTQYEGLPLKVEYSITERGRKLTAVMVSIKDLASESIDVSCRCPMETSCGRGEDEFECPGRRERSPKK